MFLISIQCYGMCDAANHGKNKNKIKSLDFKKIVFKEITFIFYFHIFSQHSFTTCLLSFHIHCPMVLINNWKILYTKHSTHMHTCSSSWEFKKVLDFLRWSVRNSSFHSHIPYIAEIQCNYYLELEQTTHIWYLLKWSFCIQINVN